MRVLLIEDDAAMAKSIEMMLGQEGFNVYRTEYGEEGLDLGKLYDYDIIVLDLNLPDMHGYDVLKKLRAAKRSEEHTSELQSLMRISYAVFCLKKKKTQRKIYKHKY